jgi:hypothetical protein
VAIGLARKYQRQRDAQTSRMRPAGTSTAMLRSPGALAKIMGDTGPGPLRPGLESRTLRTYLKAFIRV